MALRYRRRAYRNQKREFFSRGGRAYGGGRPGRYEAREDRADITIAVGRRRIWVFNNTFRDIVVPAGGYITVEIVFEGEGRMGYRYRAVLLSEAEAEGRGRGREEGGPEERLEDWV
jgi:hypothetical protein